MQESNKVDDVIHASTPTRNSTTPTQPKASPPSSPSSSSHSASKHTVVAVVTVVVDGETILSSQTTVEDDSSADNSNGSNVTDDTADGTPFTSTLVQDGSTIIVTGIRDANDGVKSSGVSLASTIAISAMLGSVVSAAMLVMF
ncbi:hypothetical protein GGI26_001726 [Coemansia sp. RSA 1358]|uniref:REJ domain-containing protein n=1 Tax=Coemansia umbellata TaxID=1424467 RepID=A0ABQ8PW69_9FUNG|nr:hypothetical protein EDC05_000276 [Coemansia umbellata]KAJ2624151.1 hypothetical protein GGI26_001726 [Coemansia sp. RSA 1358]